ncbi:MAG: NAD-dependent epimerase/dehydratase family protein [Chloroflexi bacterium]|nr:NAD-dependent epimerase/dehydratase family protein [Chloroflexota bacterium]
MKVLVTGATGFIGGNLARMLWRDGYQVRALVRPGSNTTAIDGTGIEPMPGDILDRKSVARAAQGCQALFHCAAAYTFWSPDPKLVYRTNVEGTATVLDAAGDAGVPKIVYTSTVSTIGFAPGGPGNEETPLDPKILTGAYKRSKYQAEQVALDRAAQGLPVVVVNPTAPVGPWDVKPTPTGRVVLDFLKGRIPAYISTGMNLVDVEDVAAGHILAMKKGRPGQRYILGNINVTLMQLFSMLGEITGLRPPRWQVPFWLVTAAGYLDQMVEGNLMGREPRIPVEGIKAARHPMYVDCTKAVDDLGLPQSPVEKALANAVHWFTEFGYLKRKAA